MASHCLRNKHSPERLHFYNIKDVNITPSSLLAQNKASSCRLGSLSIVMLKHHSWTSNVPLSRSQVFAEFYFHLKPVNAFFAWGNSQKLIELLNVWVREQIKKYWEYLSMAPPTPEACQGILVGYLGQRRQGRKWPPIQRVLPVLTWQQPWHEFRLEFLLV